MKHLIDTDRVGATVWAYCSCGDWSARACTSEAEARTEHGDHVRQERDRQAMETPIGFPAWDDPTDLYED